MGNGNQKAKIQPDGADAATKKDPSPQKPTLRYDNIYHLDNINIVSLSAARWFHSPEEIAKREKRAKQRQQVYTMWQIK